MHIFQKIHQLREFLDECRKNDQSIGLVPTMGALHKGHRRLMEVAVAENDITVCSIFVNPTQFNDPADLKAYPRNLDKDLEMIRSAGVTVTFTPEVGEVYPDKPTLSIDFGHMDRVLEGKYRDDHFNGVAIVVSKLFNIVQPDKAYFGQKDFQQLMIIEKLVKDLSFQTKVIRVPTVREDDGLAFSSRNQNLTPAHRTNAPVLFKALTKARKDILSGQKVADVKPEVLKMCKDMQADVEYFEAVDAGSLEIVDSVDEKKDIFLCIAARFGSVRLIDNIPLFD